MGNHLSPICDALAARMDGDVGMTYPWMSALWESHGFGSCEDTLLLEDGSGPIGLLPLVRKTQRWAGLLPLRSVSPLSLVYSTCAGWAIPSLDAAGFDALFDFIDGSFPWDCFSFQLDDSSPLQGQFEALAARRGLMVQPAPFPHPSPYLTLPPTVDEYLASRSPNFRMNLKRKNKKIAAAGDLVLEINTTPESVEQSIKDVFSIENKSWKIITRTAITMSEQRIRFYTLLAERMAPLGRLRIYVLKLNGKPIAFDYGLLYEGRYFMLKTSYDEELKELSPGNNLRWQILLDLIGAGCREINFLWGDEPYKLQWGNGVRTYTVLDIYNKTAASRGYRLNLSLKKMIRRLRVPQAAVPRGEGNEEQPESKERVLSGT